MGVFENVLANRASAPSTTGVASSKALENARKFPRCKVDGCTMPSMYVLKVAGQSSNGGEQCPRHRIESRLNGVIAAVREARNVGLDVDEIGKAVENGWQAAEGATGVTVRDAQGNVLAYPYESLAPTAPNAPAIPTAATRPVAPVVTRQLPAGITEREVTAYLAADPTEQAAYAASGMTWTAWAALPSVARDAMVAALGAAAQ